MADATKNYEQQISAANKALIETYKSIGNISHDQIENLGKIIDLQKTEAARAREIQQK